MAPKISNQEIEAAFAHGEALRKLVTETHIPTSLRNQMAGGALMASQEHHHGMLVLLNSGLYATAFAVLRIQFEAYVRGEWLGTCARDVQIEKYSRGKDDTKIGLMISELERTGAFENKILSSLKKQAWATMCDYTHTGALQIQRFLTPDSIEPIHSREEVLEVLRLSEMILAEAVISTLFLASDEQRALRVYELAKARLT